MSTIAADTPTTAVLKAPFPAFGGKSRIADEVWARLGDVDNYVEPFAFSSAVLLRRPTGHFNAFASGCGAEPRIANPDRLHRARIETINDRNAFVSNFWRAVRADPDAVALHADWPVNETDLHARHRWLVGSDKAAACLTRVREDPEAFDARIAGWWCWGACCWIGSGWCDETPHRNMGVQRAFLTSDGMGNGVARMPTAAPHPKIPHMDATRSSIADGRGESPLPDPLQGQVPALGAHEGNGVLLTAANPAGMKRVKLSGNGIGTGVNAAGVSGNMTEEESFRMELGSHGRGRGVSIPSPMEDESRPQLADQFARGRGVNGNDGASACTQRREWIVGWMRSLADRLRPVWVCCGHWSRICDSPSTMTRLGLTGVFLDPPYRKSLGCGKVNRTAHIYASDKTQDINALCDEVQAWCLKWGGDPMVRIALCGLEGEYPEIERAGWDVLAWKSNGGYGNQGGGGAKNENARRERVWFSPACLQPGKGEGGLFA